MLSTTIPEVLTLDEVADYLRLPLEVVQRQAQRGELPGRKIEDQWRFLRSAIDTWLTTQTGRTTLLQQFGAFADDPSLAELRMLAYAERNRAEVEEA